MSKILTLYDILKVSPDAPSEVIRASYKALSQKHHPDRNPEDAGAPATMQQINRAYAILSDPEKRHQHDAWIAQREREISAQGAARPSQGRPVNKGGPVSGHTSHTTSKEDVTQTSATRSWRSRSGFFWASLSVLLIATVCGYFWQRQYDESAHSGDSLVRCRPVTLNESLQWSSYPAGGLYNCKDSNGLTTYPAVPPTGAVVEPHSVDSAVGAGLANSVPVAKRSELGRGECERLFSFNTALGTEKPMKSAMYKCLGTDGRATYVTESEFNRMRDRLAGIAPPDGRAAKYQRPAVAQNGSPWPKAAAYVEGYKKLNVEGHSKVTVDNAANDSDMFIKLYSMESGMERPVRHIFVPAHERFTMSRIDAGSYDIRYLDLNSGVIQKSEMFYLEEVASDDGIQYSDVSLTLYKVNSGNMEVYVIDGSEF
ncbi:MAG: J domain-containing protein [Dokdonella sp.]|jgi:hypothetical protein|uniref:J domain-containing protein n=1 Tax=Dokdonella sp. TaxID=2291710 RepID=UPI0025BE1281|nr:J domain-containing protein [Dokdonella sp.]MBK8122053.1 J domain-containing protein [Dokdonella sp.]HNV07080.1 J domain-containing protein [Dokdonella sp.]